MKNRSKIGKGNSFSPADMIVIAAAVIFSAVVKYGIRSFFAPLESVTLLFSLAFYGSALLLPGLVLLFFFGSRKSLSEERDGKSDGILLFLTALTAPLFFGMVSSFFGNAGDTPSLQLSGFPDLLMMFFSYAVLPAVCEEFFYRCALTRSITVLAGREWGIVIPALLFGIAHVSSENVFSGVVFPALFTGLFYGTLAEGGKGWKRCALCHFINNGCAFVMAAAQSADLTVLTRVTGVMGAFLGISFIPCVIMYILRRKKNDFTENRDV
ncbi:MAG: CPBP family intramembrane metalloprotease [Ruminococcaceae bacterium]|nr:CPBP family intramembrane metalloprotease [Oscillospiraceae bacterium]